MYGYPPAPEIGGNEVEERYEVLAPIGNGVFGTVTKVRDRMTGETLAMKHLHLEDEMSDGVPSHVIREVSLLRDFVHPNVVQLVGIHITGVTDYNLIFEYVENDLHKVLKRQRSEEQLLPMPLLVKYAQELLSGIHACHVRLIIHRDLKPQNILIGREGLKICDFGLARIFSLPLKPYTHDVVTLWYRAPEILLGIKEYSTEVDMWSAGCIIAEMATGMPTFPGDSEVGTVFKIMRLLGTPTEETWPGITSLEHFKQSFPRWRSADLQPIAEVRPELEQVGFNLIGRLLTMNPQMRLGSRRAKMHDFFKRYAANNPQDDPGAMAAILAGNAP